MIRTKIISYEARTRIFWMLISIMVASAGLYLFALTATVRNTALRQNLELAVSDLGSKESSLEYSYINLKNKISLEVAYAQGYQDISHPIYISRAESSALTMNTR